MKTLPSQPVDLTTQWQPDGTLTIGRTPTRYLVEVAIKRGWMSRPRSGVMQTAPGFHPGGCERQGLAQQLTP